LPACDSVGTVIVAGFKFRIGTKLGIVAGIGVLLVSGMVLSQQSSNRSIEQALAGANIQQEIGRHSMAAETAIRHMHVAIRDILLARTSEETDKAIVALQEFYTDATTQLDAAIPLTVKSEDRERFLKIKSLDSDYTAAAAELSAAQKDSMKIAAKRAQIATDWAKTSTGVLNSPGLAALANRNEIEAELREVRTLVHGTDAATWRYAMTGEPTQKELAIHDLDEIDARLKRTRAQAADKAVTDGIDALSAAAKNFRSSTTDFFKAQDLKAQIQTTRLPQIALESVQLIGRAVAVALQTITEANADVTGEMTQAGRFGLVVGGLVVAVLIGSAAFSFLGIARPIGRLNDAMTEIANGHIDIEIPGAARRDEIGDMSKTVTVIRENAERSALQRQEETNRLQMQQAAQRKAEMRTLADSFELEVGNIVGAVSSLATELEGAATTLTKTASTTQQLSNSAAGASDAASNNVQSVAAASEQLSSSLNEIARQVQESSKIAAAAVEQARQTDGRINELSRAASQIGDVVKMITAIAEQTNLLALNATIEAARAGDSGRGFAVVANEVKALAAQTAKATGDISNHIAGMQTATQESVTAIKAIGSTIDRIAEIASTIAASVSEQDAATQEISRNAQQAAQRTAEVASNITDANRGTSDTGSASNEVLTSAKTLAGKSVRLKDEVDKFLKTVRAT
jgi:methyl-accepting chemotaxis protein